MKNASALLLGRQERSRLLHSYHNLIHKYSEDLAALVTAESGKPLAEARGEVAYGNDYIQWFAGEARRVYVSRPRVVLKM